MKFLAKSVPSKVHPDRNEDVCLADPKLQLAAVFDGVGGQVHGERASYIVAESISQSLRSVLQNMKPEDIKNLLKKAITDASSKIIKLSPNSATTATVVKFVKSDKKIMALIAHVGDSRAYLARNGKLIQITEDDNLVLESGLSKEGTDRINQRLDQVDSEEEFELLNPQEKKYFLGRNIITQALGTDIPPSPHIYKINLGYGDKLILTSDGVHDNLTKAEIEKVFKSDPKDLAKALVEKAYKRSEDADHIRAKPDDISAVVVESLI